MDAEERVIDLWLMEYFMHRQCQSLLSSFQTLNYAEIFPEFLSPKNEFTQLAMWLHWISSICSPTNSDNDDYEVGLDKGLNKMNDIRQIASKYCRVQSQHQVSEFHDQLDEIEGLLKEIRKKTLDKAEKRLNVNSKKVLADLKICVSHFIGELHPRFPTPALIKLAKEELLIRRRIECRHSDELEEALAATPVFNLHCLPDHLQELHERQLEKWSMRLTYEKPKLKRMMETAEICKKLKELNHNILTDNLNGDDVHPDENGTEEQEEKENSNCPVATAQQTLKSSTTPQKCNKNGSELTKKQAMKKSLKTAPLNNQDEETEDESESVGLSSNAGRAARTRMSLRRKSKCLDDKSNNSSTPLPLNSRRSNKVLKFDFESSGNERSCSSSPEKVDKMRKGKNKLKKKLYNEEMLLPRNSSNNGSPGNNTDLDEGDNDRRNEGCQSDEKTPNEDNRVPSTSTSRQKKTETVKIISPMTENTTRKPKPVENLNDSMDLDEQLTRRRNENDWSNASPSKRKMKKKSFWTVDEEKRLAIAIKRLGPGRWAEIRQLANLKNRSSIDIKDKWRNINKSEDKVKEFLDLAQ